MSKRIKARTKNPSVKTAKPTLSRRDTPIRARITG
jgi:hypothetical protein